LLLSPLIVTESVYNRPTGFDGKLDDLGGEPVRMNSAFVREWVSDAA
jgi:hypothetical protein